MHDCGQILLTIDNGTCISYGFLARRGQETNGEMGPLGSEILNGNDYSKLLLLGLGCLIATQWGC